MPMADGRVISLRRLYILPVAVWILILAAGYFPTQLIAGWCGIQAMIIAQLAVVGIVYVTIIPAMRKMVNAKKSRQFEIALKAGLVRFFLALLVIVVILWSGSVETTVFVIWAAIAYLIMIKIETVMLIKWEALIDREHQ